MQVEEVLSGHPKVEESIVVGAPDELPYTATGKKKHFEVRAMALKDQKRNVFERP